MEAMWAAAGGGTSEGAAAGGGAAGVAEGAESESAAGAEEEDEDYLAQMEAMWANVPMVEAPPPSPSPTPPPTPPLTPPIEGRRRDGGEVEAPHDAIALPSDAEEEGEQGDEAEFADEYFYDKYEQDFY